MGNEPDGLVLCIRWAVLLDLKLYARDFFATRLIIIPRLDRFHAERPEVEVAVTTRQAVVDGFGLGIGPLPVLQADLTAGNFVAPFATITVPRKGYVTLIPFDADKTSSLTGFIEWLIAEGTGS